MSSENGNETKKTYWIVSLFQSIVGIFGAGAILIFVWNFFVFLPIPVVKFSEYKHDQNNQSNAIIFTISENNESYGYESIISGLTTEFIVKIYEEDRVVSTRVLPFEQVSSSSSIVPVTLVVGTLKPDVIHQIEVIACSKRMNLKASGFSENFSIPKVPEFNVDYSVPERKDRFIVTVSGKFIDNPVYVRVEGTSGPLNVSEYDKDKHGEIFADRFVVKGDQREYDRTYNKPITTSYSDEFSVIRTFAIDESRFPDPTGDTLHRNRDNASKYFFLTSIWLQKEGDPESGYPTRMADYVFYHTVVPRYIGKAYEKKPFYSWQEFVKELNRLLKRGDFRIPG